MIGVYDYTVILTYLSLLAGCTGTIIAMSGVGHPYIGMFLMLFAGLCDGFDGRVARTKKNRTELEKKFGMQIDSFSDLISFGLLPAAIGMSMLSSGFGGLASAIALLLIAPPLAQVSLKFSEPENFLIATCGTWPWAGWTNPPPWLTPTFIGAFSSSSP